MLLPEEALPRATCTADALPRASRPSQSPTEAAGTPHIPTTPAVFPGDSPRVWRPRLLACWRHPYLPSRQESYHTAERSRVATMMRKRRKERSIPLGVGQRLDGRRRIVGWRQGLQGDVAFALPSPSQNDNLPVLFCETAGKCRGLGSAAATGYCPDVAHGHLLTSATG
jgi:hypothetical protein